MEREPTERTENPLFSPLAPVQLSLSRGRHALSGALQQRAGPLLAIGYWLLAIGYRLSAIRYALRATPAPTIGRIDPKTARCSRRGR